MENLKKLIINFDSQVATLHRLQEKIEESTYNPMLHSEEDVFEYINRFCSILRECHQDVEKVKLTLTRKFKEI